MLMDFECPKILWKSYPLSFNGLLCQRSKEYLGRSEPSKLITPARLGQFKLDAVTQLVAESNYFQSRTILTLNF